MAAPKKWGYDRDQEIGDEMLVAWSDGDLIELLVSEVNERLLRHREERQHVAAWARAAHDTTSFKGRDWLEPAPHAAVDFSKALARR